MTPTRAFVTPTRGDTDKAFEWLDKAVEQLAQIKFKVTLPP